MLTFTAKAQDARLRAERRAMSASKLSEKPKIDGEGNDAAWLEIPAFSDPFTQLAPQNLAPSKQPTSIKIGYTDYALYVLAVMHDPAPHSIARELGLRDDFGRVADRFGIVLDTYNKGQNAFYFAVTSAGVQLDLYITPTSEDTSWDAVWNSEVQLTEQGWVAEMEIPWSALRFAKRPEQLWGVNFMRVIRSINEESFWNPVDASVSGLVNQSGLLRGINDIDPPLRLQFFPYVSAIAGYDRGSGSTSTNLGGGMDLKWGISESFTLDMALVPDFSQVQSDNQVLNLSPFEVQFAENRPFFTEGTELFNKRSLFYSRRVGHVFGTFRPEVSDTATVLSRPNATRLINATKLSGRTHKGLGVGLFNAVTNAAFLEVQDTLRLPGTETYSLRRRELMIDPVTNFNVAVLDQNLPNNSNIALINTNVSRANGGRDANVSGAELRLRDKHNRYQFEGFGALSYVWQNLQPCTDFRQRTDGHRYFLSFGKISGNFQYRLSRNVESDRYEINDMGILQAPNKRNTGLYLGYHVFKPFWIFNQLSNNLNLNYNRLYKPNTYTGFNGNVNVWMQFRNFWGMGAGYSRKILPEHDYFEPRVAGYFFTRQPSYHGWVYVESDNRKRLAVGAELWQFRRRVWDAHDWGLYLGPRYRINNFISIFGALNYSTNINERGFVNRLYTTTTGGSRELQHIVFGNRTIQTVEPSARLNITFNNKMGLNIRARYYWSRVRYADEFYYLQKNGSLLATEAYKGDQDGDGLIDHNVNFNSFNLDFFYSWQIAPGSFLQFGWKDAAYDFSSDARHNFSENMERFWSKPHTHTLSLKLTYFLDYLMIRNAL
ncbi:DUF5916 domain-containing protein [Cesiribacter andamanensis]|uniref:Uncharacterized protein n=1 Tax=Cesiribacter andamanensis AMV16 TaxID=1279009 RepID=M7MZE3_9BACT|nr:DUF5916 domain-containing protein [Cesiribacter andamanensis]EMR01783.1 hypothetical protein ADICEAN_03074 [Cesiribacter andamanensis AMV16]